MGACISITRRRQKDHRQLPKQMSLTNQIVFDNKQLPPLPLTIYSNQQSQHPYSLSSNLNIQSSSLTKSILSPINTNSSVPFYSTNTNNNNCNRVSGMSPSTSKLNTTTHIPVSKTRTSANQSQLSSVECPRSENVTTTVNITTQRGSTRPMSTTNRAPSTSSSHNAAQLRSGFIPRPIAPRLQQVRASSTVGSSSISSSSTISTHSSSPSISQRATKTPAIPKPTSNRSATSSLSHTSTSKSRIVPSSHSNKGTTKTTNRLYSGTSLPVSTASSSSSVSNPTVQTNVNAIPSRHKTHQRMNFYTRCTSITNSLKSSSIIKEENNEQTSTDEQTARVRTANQNNNLKTDSSQQISSLRSDSAYPRITSRLNRSSSVQHSATDRQRNGSRLSSLSLLSDVLKHDTVLEDDNCSIKSDDLLCEFDDTLTLESVSKSDGTDSFSLTSLHDDKNEKSTTTVSTIATKPNMPLFQNASKGNHVNNAMKTSTADKINANLRESLDELTRLSNRMNNAIGVGEHHVRLLTRSISLKPPANLLPPREDAEQITMDIESYRQVMKDVMIVKTILHQLDRLLKNSDGTNMTDSMVGSFHESMTGLRHCSLSNGDGYFRNSIDENSTYDDLAREIIILRKEREQDKQTIKLLQEQMYKYSSQTNSSSAAIRS